MQSIRIVFIDLDGTLLSSSHKILESSAFALSELIHQNIHVVITTGRCLTGMKEAIKSLPFHLPAPVSVHNGALILNRGKITRKVPIAVNTVINLVKKARSLNIRIGFQTESDTYLDQEIGEDERAFNLQGMKPIVVDDILDLDIELIKVSFYGHENDINGLLSYFSMEGGSEEYLSFAAG